MLQCVPSLHQACCKPALKSLQAREATLPTMQQWARAQQQAVRVCRKLHGETHPAHHMLNASILEVAAIQLEAQEELAP
eukprot:358796-Chlamydomonas_euryale.AAC.11